MTIDWGKVPEGTTGVMVANFESISRGGKTYKGKIEFIPFDEPRRDCYAEGPDCWTYYPVQATWNGEGLPPESCEFESRFIDTEGSSWAWGKVIAHGKRRIFYVDRTGDEWSHAPADMEFRPIRTPEQIEAEERERRIAELAKVIKVSGWESPEILAAYLDSHDYRKQVAP